MPLVIGISLEYWAIFDFYGGEYFERGPLMELFIHPIKLLQLPTRFFITFEHVSVSEYGWILVLY